MPKRSAIALGIVTWSLLVTLDMVLTLARTGSLFKRHCRLPPGVCPSNRRSSPGRGATVPVRSTQREQILRSAQDDNSAPVAARGVSQRGGASRRGSEALARDQASDRGRVRPSRSPVRPQAQIPRKRGATVTRRGARYG